MPRPKVIDAKLIRKAGEALERHHHRLCLKLHAVVAAADHPITVVAYVMGVHRQTFWVWIKSFSQYGVSGLRDRPKGYRRAKLGAGPLAQVAWWLEEGKNSRGQSVHWTPAKLQYEIKKRFGVSIALTLLWRLA